MNPPVPTEKQLRQYGLMMAGVLSFFVVLFFYKAWHTAGMALAVWVLFFLTLALLAPPPPGTGLPSLDEVWAGKMLFVEICFVPPPRCWKIEKSLSYKYGCYEIKNQTCFPGLFNLW